MKAAYRYDGCSFPHLCAYNEAMYYFTGNKKYLTLSNKYLAKWNDWIANREII